MSWNTGEVWLEADLTWFRDRGAAPAIALSPPLPFPVPPGLAASRRRREAWKHKRSTRRVRRTALMLSPAVILPFALRGHASGNGAKLVLEDPPSLTFHLGQGAIRTTDAHGRPFAPVPAPRIREKARAPVYP